MTRKNRTPKEFLLTILNEHLKFLKRTKKRIPKKYHEDIETEEKRTKDYHARVTKKEFNDYDTLKNEFEKEKVMFNRKIDNLNREIRRLNNVIRRKDKEIEILQSDNNKKDNQIEELKAKMKYLGFKNSNLSKQVYNSSHHPRINGPDQYLYFNGPDQFPQHPRINGPDQFPQHPRINRLDQFPQHPRINGPDQFSNQPSQINEINDVNNYIPAEPSQYYNQARNYSIQTPSTPLQANIQINNNLPRQQSFTSQASNITDNPLPESKNCNEIIKHIIEYFSYQYAISKEMNVGVTKSFAKFMRNNVKKITSFDDYCKKFATKKL
ncbi:8851_t:CDS:2 [Gigaspora margarita]|uniref:8851_t:CDS:1 n=1 Tax=Gigaspora margarita TaxID=4874 RepID=A0ABM8W5V7_GIGMA|nr:8851_t:CDS:2 [Gigaspora margarita]